MKIAILGSQGRLGQELVYFFQEEHEVVPLAHFNLDIQDYAEVCDVLNKVKADCIINTAAITDSPDSSNRVSEDDVFQVNTAGAAHIAMFCKQNKTPLIHISCAAVLAGNPVKKESTKREALEILGQSKLEAEEMIEKIYADEKQKQYLIVRTGLLFGSGDHSFIKNISRLIDKKDHIEAVADIRHSFSSTRLVAEFLAEKIKAPLSGNIEHCAHPEIFTVAELVEFLAEKKGKNIKIKKVLAESVDETAGDFSLVCNEKFKSIETYL